MEMGAHMQEMCRGSCDMQASDEAKGSIGHCSPVSDSSSVPFAGSDEAKRLSGSGTWAPLTEEGGRRSSDKASMDSLNLASAHRKRSHYRVSKATSPEATNDLGARGGGCRARGNPPPILRPAAR